MSLLRVENLSVGFGPVEAVRGVSFSIEPGEIFSLVGPNGAGKTTTLAAISGLVPPTGGRILFEGQDLARIPAHARVGRGIVQVPEGRLVLAGMSVAENLELGGYRRPKDEIAETMARMLERFPILRERREQMAGSLSGGEQQMLAIARALMAKPRLLLMDEPSLGLAPLVVQEVFRIVTELRDAGLTILLVEQNARQALNVSSRACVLENGEIALSGPARDLKSDPRVIAHYLGG